MLRNLCEFHLEQCEHFWQLVKAGDAEEALRVESIGLDAQNRRYWIFSDARMYRDRVPVKNVNKLLDSIEDESNWELVCLTCSDYEEFLQNGLSSKPKDRALIKLINQEWMPELGKILSYQLAQHRKYFRPVNTRQEILLPRKRSSRLFEKEIVEIQQREAEEAARKERERELREARAALIGRDFNLPSTVPEDTADLALQREVRARERELKKEKEAQVRAIEEAFYSQMVDVDGEEDTTENQMDNQIDDQTEKNSPIKLVLKINSVDVKTVPAEVSEFFAERDGQGVAAAEEQVDANDAVDIVNEESIIIPTLEVSVNLAITEDINSIDNITSVSAIVDPIEKLADEGNTSVAIEQIEDFRDVAELLSSQFSQQN